MSILRQFLVVIVLGAIAAGGYAFQTGYWPVTGSDSATAKTGAGKRGGKKSKGKRAAPVIVAKVETRTFRRMVEAVGTTRALQSVNIVPSSAGRIRALKIEPGRSVKAGAVLARLNDEIQQADLSEASAKLAEATTSLSRAQKLYRNRNIAEARVIELRVSKATAVADVARAKQRLKDRTVRAPFSGLTGMREIDIGARVDTDTMLTTLDDISSIEIETRLPESLFPIIQKAAVVRAESAAFPDRTFVGTVVAIDKRIDPVGRAFEVRVRVPNADGTLPAGMFMRLSIQLNERDNPAIPEESLVVQGDEKFAFLIDETGERVSKASIKTGQRRAGYIEITSGIKPGDRVVTEGTHRLKDNKAITIKNADSIAGTPTADLTSTSQNRAVKKDGG